MPASNEIEIVATLSRMNGEIDAVPAGDTREALRASFGDLVVLLADAGYDLRRTSPAA